MALPVERTKTPPARRGITDRREVRLMLPDPRSPEVRRRIAVAVAALPPDSERDALDWTEAVSDFDEPPASPA